MYENLLVKNFLTSLSHRQLKKKGQWITYSKQPIGGPEQVLEYLGRKRCMPGYPPPPFGGILSTTQRYLGKVNDSEATRWIETLYE
jgi:hypothetical protein